MFGERLPTINTEIWICEDPGLNEKPTVPNRMLQKDIALNETSIKGSLAQEVIRRLKIAHLLFP